MKRTTLISASLLLAFAGCTCGQGWRPNFLTRMNNRIHGVSNVGEPCDAGGCREPAPAAPMATGGCDSCGNTGSAQFGGYEGQVMDGQIIGSYEGTPVGGYTATPAYTNSVPNYPASPQTYTAPQSQQARMEGVRAKSAN